MEASCQQKELLSCCGGMFLSPPNPNPGSEPRLFGLPLRHSIALAVFVLVVVALLGLWPYQHWTAASRNSILWGWFRVVNRDDEWWFCLLVPLLVGWLIHRKRAELKKLAIRPDWLGLLPLAVAGVLYWMGYKVDTGYLGFVAAHTLLLGLVLLLAGREWMRHLFFPWLFLAFMWPLFPLEERLAFPLRMLTARLSGGFLNLVGLGVVREGTGLFSAADPGLGLEQGALFRLDVEEPCSGIRSLFSLLMVSALYGYLALRSPVRRLLLFLAAIPLAVTGNFVRMVLLAVASRWLGAEFAVGRNVDGHQEMSFFHSMAGYAVYAVALAGMFGICSVLERRHWKRLFRAVGSAPPEGEGGAGRHWWAGPAVVLGVAAGILLACVKTDASLTLAEPGVRLNLPLRLDGFEGQELGMTSQEQNILDPGVTLARNLYRKSSGDALLYTTVIICGAGKRTLHRPEVCLPGQGWMIASSDQVDVPMADGKTVTATLLRLFRDGEVEGRGTVRMRAMNLYWYVGSDGSTMPDYYGHISRGYLDAILKNLNHRWSMISLFAPVLSQGGADQAWVAEFALMEDLKSLAKAIQAPILRAAEP
jgi:exosortase